MGGRSGRPWPGLELVEGAGQGPEAAGLGPGLELAWSRNARPWTSQPGEPQLQPFLGLFFFSFLVRGVYQEMHFNPATLSIISNYHKCCYLTHKTERKNKCPLNLPLFGVR